MFLFFEHDREIERSTYKLGVNYKFQQKLVREQVEKFAEIDLKRAAKKLDITLIDLEFLECTEKDHGSWDILIEITSECECGPWTERIPMPIIPC